MGRMTQSGFEPVNLGREQTHALLPHRPPLLLVDEIRALGSGPQPALRASYRIAADEPVLAGHFPGRPLWPGAYTIEGMAQTCALLGGLLAAVAAGRAPLALPRAWSTAAARPSADWPLLAMVHVKLLSAVTPPAELIYEVVLTHVIDAIHRFDAEVVCGRDVVASGTLSVASQGRQP
jgi:3-hydroxyacyl-[acyl-carrier-protein] dehydratase